VGAAFVAVRVPIVRPLMPAFVVVILENFEAKDRCIIVQYVGLSWWSVQMTGIDIHGAHSSVV